VQNRTSVNRFGIVHGYGTDQQFVTAAHSLRKVHAKFGFLAQMQDIYPKDLDDELVDFNHSDMDLQKLILECEHFEDYASTNQNQQHTQAQQPIMVQSYDILKSDGLESTFPNIEVALRIHLTLKHTKRTSVVGLMP